MQADGAWEGSAVYIALNFYLKKKKKLNELSLQLLKKIKTNPPKVEKDITLDHAFSAGKILLPRECKLVPEG